jgi:hypothetical protein
MRPSGFSIVATLVFSCGFGWGMRTAGAFNWNQADEQNVNSRYTVESIQINGENEARLPRALRAELKKLIGDKFHPSALADLTSRMKRELQARSVIQKLERGSEPERVKIVLEVSYNKHRVDATPTKLVYHSRHGLSGDAMATMEGFKVGIVTNGDDAVERYSGLSAGYERAFAGGRVRPGFQFEAYHQQWNGATLQALNDSPDVPGAYRNRLAYTPSLTLEPIPGLTLLTGVRIQNFQTQFPAARTESTNSMINTLRYQKAWEDAGFGRQTLNADYTLRAATKMLSSDFAYTRHEWALNYLFERNRDQVVAEYSEGAIGGRAPLFDRFVLGNSSTLRGWDKYAIAPLGGDRMVRGSVEFRHRSRLAVFYDTGAVWDRGHTMEVRHSAGIGMRSPNFFCFVAFPLKDGRLEPQLMTGVNF